MEITPCPPERADVLVPLNLQVQALHSAAAPHLYVTDPDPKAVGQFLQNMLKGGMTALIAGPIDAPLGYLLYDVEDRPAHAMRHHDKRAMLHHICVDVSVRRQGIGRALITDMLERIEGQVARVVVTYAVFNSASAALMTEMGFTAEMTLAARAL